VAEGPRRLAAVMVTDIVGYSALTQRDEALALRLLREHEDLIRPVLVLHGGHEVKTLGDGFLVEFDSALDACRCAIEIQRSFHNRSRKSGGPPIEVRIGIHVGDVVHRDGDVFGDAVNIASRIQPLAEPGGITISGAVQEQVRNKLDLPIRELEPVALKNIQYPVSLHRIELPWKGGAQLQSAPWAGREPELASITRSLEGASRGEGSILLVSGEAGIGKTRLIEEAQGRTEALGLKWLRARGLPGDTSPPYAYWAEAAREYLRELPPGVFQKVTGDQAAEISRLAPELSDRLGVPGGPAGTDPDQERMRFYDGIVRFFLSVARQTPLVLFFDDLQWADPASLRLLQYAARRVPGNRLLVVGAYRDTDLEEGSALRELLQELTRQRLATQIPLRRLDPSHVAQLVGSMLNTDHPMPDVVHLVFERTGGNPFFVEEVVRSLIESGTIFLGDKGWERRSIADVRLPDSVRAVIQQRLRRLDPETNEVLRWASVIGMEFNFDLLQKVSGVEETKLFDVLDRLLAARLVKEVAESHAEPRYGFTDHQVRSTLYEEINRARRRRYHLQVARAMEDAGAGKHPERFGELAQHYFEGSELAKSLEYTVRAAQRASELYAHEESLQLLRTALELVGDDPTDPKRAELLMDVAREADLAGHPEEGIEHLKEAAKILEPRGDKAHLSQTYARLSELYADRLMDLESAIPYGERQLRLLEGSEEGSDLTLAHSQLGYLFNATGDYDRARVHFEKTLELARRFPAVDEEATAVQFLAMSLPVTEKARAFELLEEGIKIAQSRGGVRYATKLTNMGETLVKVKADSENAARYLRTAREVSARMGLPNYVALADSMLAFRVHLPAGNWEEAERLAERAVQASPSPAVATSAIATLTMLAIRRGQFERAAGYLPHPPTSGRRRIRPDAIEEVELLRAEFALATGDLVEAERELQTLYEAVHPLPNLVNAIWAKAIVLSTFLELRLRQNRLPEAEQLLTELTSLSKEVGEHWAMGVSAESRGLVELARSQPVEAAADFTEAARTWKALGYPYEQATCLYRLALADRESGNDAGALAALREALGIFRHLEAKPSIERVEEAERELAREGNIAFKRPSSS
jgi:class 3 adenylate cyclase/tetratricopeptide (TPR) repeat protein